MESVIYAEPHAAEINGKYKYYYQEFGEIEFGKMEFRQNVIRQNVKSVMKAIDRLQAWNRLL